jgi:hypothetical protein
VRDVLRGERGMPRRHVKATGYWLRTGDWLLGDRRLTSRTRQHDTPRVQGPAPPGDPLLSKRLDAPTRGEASRARRKAALGAGRWKRLRAWAAGRPAPDPLPAVLGMLDGEPYGYGICCSGGGIRSAAFNLGALQTLQEHENQQEQEQEQEQEPKPILQHARYLAAVSGGAYMAAGFAMVAKFDEKAAKVEKDATDEKDATGKTDETDDGCTSVDSDAKLVRNPRTPPFHPGSPEEQYLRNRCSYMAPGFTGRLRLVARVLLGVLVNLLLLGSLLFVAGWLLGAIVLEWLYPDLSEAGGDAPTTTAGLVALGLLGAAIVLGLGPTLVRFQKEWARRVLWAWAARMLVLATLTALLLVAVPALIEWLREEEGTKSADAAATARDAAAAAGGTGTVVVLLTILAQLRARLTESRLLARAGRSAQAGVGRFVNDRLLPRLRGTLVALAAALVGPVLFTAVLAASAVAGVVADASDPGEWLLFLGALAVFALLSVFGDVTTWSLHPFYRERLSSAFALRRVTDEDGHPIAEQRPYKCRVVLSKSSVEPVRDEDKPWEWPQLVICAAANVSDAGATPPGRPVTSFTFTPRIVGGPLIGGGDVRCGALPLDGQGDPRSAALPAHARQRAARCLGAQPPPPPADEPRHDEPVHSLALAPPAPSADQRAARAQLRRRALPLRDRRRPLREPRARRAAAAGLPRRDLPGRQRRQGHPGARRRDRAGSHGARCRDRPVPEGRRGARAERRRRRREELRGGHDPVPAGPRGRAPDLRPLGTHGRRRAGRADVPRGRSRVSAQLHGRPALHGPALRGVPSAGPRRRRPRGEALPRADIPPSV